MRSRMIFRFIAVMTLALAVIKGPDVKPLHAADHKKAIVFVYQDRVADAASIIAVNRGFFKREGLDVKGRMFTSGPSCAEALIYGNAVFGTMGDTTTIIALSKSCNRFLAICSHGGGENRHRIIVRKGSGIKQVQQLEGMRIGVKKGTSTHGGLMLFAKKHGLDLKEEIMDIKPSLQLTALSAGQLDAMVASEPTPTLAVANGIGRQLSTLGGLGNDYPVFMLVNRGFASENPDMVVKFLKAIHRAAGYVQRQPDEAAAILEGVTGLGRTVIRKAMANHHYHVKLDPNTIESLRTMSSFLKGINKIKKEVDVDKCLSDRYLKMID